MDLALLLKSATNGKHKEKQNDLKFLSTITHLSLDRKSLTELPSNFNLCPSLTVLYLSENSLT